MCTQCLNACKQVKHPPSPSRFFYRQLLYTIFWCDAGVHDGARETGSHARQDGCRLGEEGDQPQGWCSCPNRTVTALALLRLSDRYVYTVSVRSVYTVAFLSSCPNRTTAVLQPCFVYPIGIHRCVLLHPPLLALLREGIIIGTHDEPKKLVFPYVYTPYLVLITCLCSLFRTVISRDSVKRLTELRVRLVWSVLLGFCVIRYKKHQVCAPSPTGCVRGGDEEIDAWDMEKFGTLDSSEDRYPRR